MTELRLFYEDEVIRGPLLRKTWEQAPDDGLQYVVVMEPYPDHPDGSPQRLWIDVTDRQLWTGHDVFDPASAHGRQEAPSIPSDWPPKRGSLLPDKKYFGMWPEVAWH